MGLKKHTSNEPFTNRKADITIFDLGKLKMELEKEKGISKKLSELSNLQNKKLTELKNLLVGHKKEIDRLEKINSEGLKSYNELLLEKENWETIKTRLEKDLSDKVEEIISLKETQK